MIKTLKALNEVKWSMIIILVLLVVFWHWVFRAIQAAI
jgi:hypothetical protein